MVAEEVGSFGNQKVDLPPHTRGPKGPSNFCGVSEEPLWDPFSPNVGVGKPTRGSPPLGDGQGSIFLATSDERTGSRLQVSPPSTTLPACSPNPLAPNPMISFGENVEVIDFSTEEEEELVLPKGEGARICMIEDSEGGTTEASSRVGEGVVIVPEEWQLHPLPQSPPTHFVPLPDMEIELPE